MASISTEVISEAILAAFGAAINEAIEKAVEDRVRQKAEELVGREVIYCVSGLIYDLGKVAEDLDDYDTYLALTSGCPDYEETVREFILEDASLSELEEIADEDGDWDDVQRAAGYDPNEPPQDSDELDIDLEDWLDADETRWKTLRDEVWKIATSYKEIAEEHSLEPDYREVFEHWIVSGWLGDKLKDQGEVVEEYLGLTIWGRCTTGQSISMDGVMCQIARNLLEKYHD